MQRAGGIHAHKFNLHALVLTEVAPTERFARVNDDIHLLSKPGRVQGEVDETGSRCPDATKNLVCGDALGNLVGDG